MPRTAKPYKLVPAEVPPRRGRGAGVYAEAIAEFAASGLGSVLVEMPGRKSQALSPGLRKAAEASGADVRVITRAGSVYLRRG
jgi:hypothetical protein